MTANSEKRHRRSLRLRGYDYSSDGAYFVTLCTCKREPLFGEIHDGVMIENNMGNIVRHEWVRSSEIRKEIVLDAFVIMPNHMHGIVRISVGATGRSPLHRLPCAVKNLKGPPQHSIGSFVAGFKSAVTTRINRMRKMPGEPVWQRNYYEHVIRNDDDLNSIREYIVSNPLKWDMDTENPGNVFCRGGSRTAPTDTDRMRRNKFMVVRNGSHP